MSVTSKEAPPLTNRIAVAAAGVYVAERQPVDLVLGDGGCECAALLLAVPDEALQQAQASVRLALDAGEARGEDDLAVARSR